MVKMPAPCDIISSSQGPSGQNSCIVPNGSTTHPSKSSTDVNVLISTNCNGSHDSPSNITKLPNTGNPISHNSAMHQEYCIRDASELTNGHAAGYIEEEVDDEPSATVHKSCDAVQSISASKPSNGEQEFIFIHDTGFTVKIHAPGCEPFDIQVSSMELVQEIHHLLMDREDTCHRTCFSLQFEGMTLDHFAELKTVEGLKDGSVIKVVEEPYTVREARIHVRHVRDLLKLLDPTDAYNGVEGSSLSFLGVISQVDGKLYLVNSCNSMDMSFLDKKRGFSRSESVDCTPPDFVHPGCKDRFILPLQPQTKDQKNPLALKVLTTSGWNPPPGTRKLHGDLMYLFIVTCEDKRFHLTSSTRGFYVNQSSEEEFNPKPASPKLVYHSLIDLLNQISPTFKRNFGLIQKKRQLRHPFERVTTPYQLYSWTSPNLDHTIDSIRAEDAFSSKLGYEEHIPGQTRDWNEELQTTRELPRKTLPERLLRERAIFKVHSDFVGAATRGAMAVIDGNVMAINPGEETKMQMFIWNNIFFSLGFDVRDHYKDLGGDAAAFVAPNNDLQGVRAYAAVDVDGLYTLGTVVINYRGYRVTAQSIIPGILEREQEQSVVYGSVDFGKTVVTHPKYLELLGKAGQSLKILPHKVYNEKGEEVQICSSVECKGIIGNDGRHYILDLLRTFPADVNFLPLEEPDEYTKEVKALGFPRKHRHKLCCLRQELVDAFFEARYLMFIRLAAYHLQQLGIRNDSKESSENNNDQSKGVEESESSLKPEKGSEEYKKMVESYASGDKAVIDSTKDIVKKAAQAAGSLKETEFDIRFNPDVYSEGVKHVESLSELKKQRQLVKDAADFLVTNQIPSLIRDCVENVIAPFDGTTLSEALHNRGINIRYLGTVANQLKSVNQLEYLHSICITELLTRVAKHLFTTYIQGVEMTNLASAVSHFLNCFLSSYTNAIASVEEVSIKSTKKKSRRKNRSSIFVTQESTEWTSVTSKSMWQSLKEELEGYYGWELTTDGIDASIELYSLQKITLLRSFCIKTGIQLLLREYNMDNKSKASFFEDDILNMFPVVKHIHPKASDAYNFYTTGQTKIQQGCLKEGYELISEALNLLNNVYGALHPEIAQCLRMLARLNYIMGEHAEAMAYQSKAVLMSEKVNGIDHPYTITEYAHLALYSFANSQVTTSLKMLYRARYLLITISGEDHPEMAIIDSNIGLILHAVGEYNHSLRFLEHALALNIRYFGTKSLKVAVSYHLVARTQSCQGDFRGALQNEKETFAVYKYLLGEEHEKTKESSECLRHLTQQAVVLQKKMNEICKGNASAVIPPIQIQSPTMSSVLDMLNVINGILFVQIRSVSPSFRSANFCNKYSPQRAKESDGDSQEPDLCSESAVAQDMPCNGSDDHVAMMNDSELE